jgi:hypothetical protein
MPDVVTITSVVDKKGMGQNTYTVMASSSQTTEPLPTLIIFGSGDAAGFGAVAMFSLGGGKYTFTFQEHDTGGALNTITVASSYGGSETLAL